MRGKIAKRLRHKIYGDMSRKASQIREQKSFIAKIIDIFKDDKVIGKRENRTVINVGLRK